MRPPKVPRVLRGAAAGSVATAGALLSHMAAGGAMPAVAGIAVPFGLSLVVCTLLAGQRLSLMRLTVAVIASQALFHTLFVLGAVPAAPAGAPATGHRMHHDMPMAMSAAPAHATPVHDMSSHTGAGMWLWHAFAAAVTIAIVHRGERTLLDLHALALAIASRARRSVAVPESVPVAIPYGSTLLPVTPELVSAAHDPFLVSVGRRGPPSQGITLF